MPYGEGERCVLQDKQLWLQPDYFEGFKCKCGACRNCCCTGWDIAVGMDEYFRLIGMEYPEEIHRRLECAFRVPDVPSPERFRLISPNWLGECPLHDADGLCMIQRDLGEAALPEICRMYPRCLKKEGSMYEALCSNSCEAVVELLMRPEQLKFKFVEMDAKTEIEARADGEMLSLGKRTVELLQGDAGSLNERIGKICGAIAGDGGYDPKEASLSDGLRALTGALEALSEDSEALRRFAAETIARYGAEKSDAAENFSADVRRFEERFPGWMRWYENILTNHLFYMNLPWVDERLKPEQVRSGLCLTYAAMRAMGAAYTAEKSSRDDLVDALAGLFRLVEHSPFYYNAYVLVKQPACLLAL